MASTPRFASQSASRSVVAELMILQPACFTRATSVRLRQSEMKAHDRRAKLLDHGAGRFGEAMDASLQRRRWHLGAKLRVVGREALEPRGLARKVLLGGLVAEEIEVDGAARARADGYDAFAHLIVGQAGAREGAEPPGFSHGDGHVDGGGIRHRRLHDGNVDAEQVEHTRVGPHDLLLYEDHLTEKPGWGFSAILAGLERGGLKSCVVSSSALMLGLGIAQAQDLEVQQPKGTWQQPKEIQVPKGPWQEPGEIQVPKGIQAVSTIKEECEERLSVVADALFDFDKSACARTRRRR